LREEACLAGGASRKREENKFIVVLQGQGVWSLTRKGRRENEVRGGLMQIGRKHVKEMHKDKLKTGGVLSERVYRCNFGGKPEERGGPFGNMEYQHRKKIKGGPSAILGGGGS